MAGENPVLLLDDDAAPRAPSAEPMRDVGGAVPRSTSTIQDTMIAGFTADEQDYIRHEFDHYSLNSPKSANGIRLRVWRDGLQFGAPKLPSAARSLLVRGFVRLDNTQTVPRLLFTEAGHERLDAMLGELATSS